MRSADFWIQQLRLEKHPEGGAYGRAYTSQLVLDHSALPGIFHGDRPVCTHIYYLLQQKEFSAFHRIQSDELWHFYAGVGLKIYEIAYDGKLETHLLGIEVDKDQLPFRVVKSGHWFAAELFPGGDYALAGCTVSPGFDFAEFELAERQELISYFPQHKELIERFTK